MKSKSPHKFSLNEYFTFTNTEKAGILVLIFLIVVVISIRYSLSYFVKPVSKIDISAYKVEIDNFKLTQIKPHKDTSRLNAKSTQTTDKESVYDINTIDTLQLNKLPGIGKVFSERIIKYRDALGGFISLNQLNEVYNLKPETINKILPYLTCKKTKIRQININTATFKEINAHPYITYEQTKAIFYLRNKQAILSFNQLFENKTFSKSEIEKLKPYITFTP
jgi:competence protein ComEA